MSHARDLHVKVTGEADMQLALCAVGHRIAQLPAGLQAACHGNGKGAFNHGVAGVHGFTD